MKTKSFKAILILVGLMLSFVQPMSAGLGKTLHEFIGNEFANFQGLYIIAGIIAVNLILYIFLNRKSEKEEAESYKKSVPGINHHRRRHQHQHHRVIKKTQ